MKRTRRIEVVRYTRRVTLSGANKAPDRAEGPAINILLEALGDAATIPEEFRHEAGAGRANGLAFTLIVVPVPLGPSSAGGPRRSRRTGKFKP